jgi:hypothetical protein
LLILGFADAGCCSVDRISYYFVLTDYFCQLLIGELRENLKDSFAIQLLRTGFQIQNPNKEDSSKISFSKAIAEQAIV